MARKFHERHVPAGVSSRRRSISRLWDEEAPSLPPPLDASSPTRRVSLARDTQMRPSILRSHCYSKCSLPIVTMAGHSWHCCRYCYYYRYCYRLRPTGEWRRGEPAASSSAALEANYTPSGPPPVLFPLFFHHVALGRAFHSFSSRLVTSRVPFFSKLFNFKSVRSVRSDSFARYFFLLFFYLHTVTVFFQFLQIPSISICFDNSESKIRRSESFSLNRGKEGGKAIEKSTVNREMYN